MESTIKYSSRDMALNRWAK